jgi:predicted permease
MNSGEIWRRIRFLFRRPQFERDLEEEMRFHIDRKGQDNHEAGMTDEEARHAARRQFGNTTSLREASREAWGLASIQALVRDIRYGARLYRRSPGFTAVAVLTLGLGLGVNIAIFMLLYNVMLRPLPYPDYDKLVKVYLTFTSDQRGQRDISFSYPKFQDLRRLSRSFQSLAAYGRGTLDVTPTGTAEGGAPNVAAERVVGEFVSSSYFPTLGVPAALGRTFSAEEDAVAGSQAVAVIADSLWKRWFASSPGVLGKSIRAGGVSLRIVGVAPEGFTGETGRAELWVPITMAPLMGKSELALTARNRHWHEVVGRLKPGVTRGQAAAEVAAVMSGIEALQPSGRRQEAYGSGVISLAESRLEPAQRKALIILYAAVGFVLLIACGNLANLTMARMVGRQREVAMRLAMGAGRGSLVRQFLAENVLLSLSGGAAGLLFATWSSRFLIYMRPESEYAKWPSYLRTLDPDSLHLTVPVLAFSALLSLASGILFGLLPALRASRGDVNEVLKQGSYGRAERRGVGFRGILLAAQMALAVVLLAGGILMMRSFAKLVNAPVGADVHNVLAFQISLPDYKYSRRNSRVFLDRMTETLRHLPGVETVVMADDVPALERDTVTDLEMPNQPGVQYIGKHDVDPEFFRFFRIPLRAGRLFTEHDPQGPKVVILTERAASTLFPGQNPIGMHLQMGTEIDDEREVVGVVGEIRYAKQKQQLPLVGDAFVTPASRSAYVAVRGAGHPAGLIPAIRKTVTGLDPELPAYNLRTLEDQIHDMNWAPRFATVLLGFFAALALGLAMVGIYGVFSFAVAARIREFGIRIATGASSADILWLVAGEGVLLSAAGLAVGLPAALFTTRVLAGMLYEVTPADPATYIATSVASMMTALGACLVPALRATRVDPMVALRNE